MNGRFLPGCATLLVALATPSAWGQDLPPSLVGALRENARRLGPFTVQTRERYTSGWSHAELAARLEVTPGFVGELMLSKEAELAFQDGGYHLRISTLIGERWNTIEYAYDGRVFYLGQPDEIRSGGRSTPPILTRTSPERMPDEGSMVGSDYLEMAGFVLPSRRQQLISRAPIQPELLAMLNDGARVVGSSQVLIDDRSLVRVTIERPNPRWVAPGTLDLGAVEKELRSMYPPTKASEEKIRAGLEKAQRRETLPPRMELDFYFDPELNHAMVRREERYSTGELISRVENSAFAEVGDRDLWLPNSMSKTYWAYLTASDVVSAEPIFAHEIAVPGGRVNPLPVDPARFVLVYDKPGTRIVDNTILPKQHVLELPKERNSPAKARAVTESPQEPSAQPAGPLAAPATGDPGGRAGVSQGGRATSRPPPRGWGWAWLIGAGVLVLTGIVGWKRAHLKRV